MALKAYLKRTLEHWPALYAALLRLRAYLHPTAGEQELRLLPMLCAADETAIDVGANHGDYTAILVGLALELLKYINLLTWPFLKAKLQKEYGPFYISVTIILWSFVSAMIVLAGADWSARRKP